MSNAYRIYESGSTIERNPDMLQTLKTAIRTTGENPDEIVTMNTWQKGNLRKAYSQVTDLLWKFYAASIRYEGYFGVAGSELPLDIDAKVAIKNA